MQNKKPQPQQGGKRPAAQPKRPRTKEEAIQQMAEKDPAQIAALLKEILRGKQ